MRSTLSFVLILATWCAAADAQDCGVATATIIGSPASAQTVRAMFGPDQCVNTVYLEDVTWHAQRDGNEIAIAPTSELEASISMTDPGLYLVWFTATEVNRLCRPGACTAPVESAPVLLLAPGPQEAPDPAPIVGVDLSRRGSNVGEARPLCRVNGKIGASCPQAIASAKWSVMRCDLAGPCTAVSFVRDARTPFGIRFNTKRPGIYSASVLPFRGRGATGYAVREPAALVPPQRESLEVSPRDLSAAGSGNKLAVVDCRPLLGLSCAYGEILKMAQV